MPPLDDTAALTKFHWTPQPKAHSLINAMVAEFLSRLPAADEFADRLKHEAGVRFIDVVDFIAVPRSPQQIERLQGVGFTHEPMPGAPDCYTHKGGIFPQVLLIDGPGMKIGVKVESVADFAATHNLPPTHVIEGDPFSRFRRVLFAAGKGAELFAIERRGYRGHEPEASDPSRSLNAMRHYETFRRRPREFENESDAYENLMRLAEAAVKDLGADFACDLFFETEREFWQRRNRAAQFQKARQDRLGIGWANHDHHTYRSSRHCFTQMIAVLEKFGFHCRERFYAGVEAGWGAQVLEQSNAGYVVFADVDLSSDEIIGDFAHEDVLAPRANLGTIGLWCALHGEAMFQAGMHHLECVFDWYSLRDQMSAGGIKTMNPFTTFPYLRQAFTEGERWPVEPARIERLLAQKLISQEMAGIFRQDGAIGSHLENLERNDGFKGFNQQGVSEIISKTDPRKANAMGA
ncbi:MAG: hypothetical protein JNK58_13680 [Phycisphaerae bacterium]|nr:hypothetical protein [Phycisphaerae bacterium]